MVENLQVWPFATGGQIAERYEWLTDGMSPAYGMEFTNRLRRDPRVILTFDGLESAGHRRWVENMVANWGARRWAVPLLCDAGETLAAASAEDLTIPVDTTHRRYVAGGTAILSVPGDPRRTALVQIEAVHEDAIDLVQPLLDDWPAFSAIAPAVACWLEGSPQFSRFTSDDAPYSVTWRLAEPMALEAAFGPAEYRGLPVFDAPVFWTQDPGYAPERRIQTLDDGIGPILLHDQGGMTLPRITLEVSAEGAAEIATHRSMIAALAGRHHPIWVPSFGSDFAPTAVPTSNAIDVEWTGFSGYTPRSNRRDVRIEMFGQPAVYRRIESATYMGQDVERLVLDAPLPVGVSASSIASISLMALCRQAADVNVLRLEAQGVVKSQFEFEGCRHGL